MGLMDLPFKYHLAFLVIVVIILVGVGLYASQPDYIEGQILEKYIDTSDQDHFKFVIIDPVGKYWVAQVTAEDYYSYDVGDWFEGEVIYADDPDSWWW